MDKRQLFFLTLVLVLPVSQAQAGQSISITQTFTDVPAVYDFGVHSVQLATGPGGFCTATVEAELVNKNIVNRRLAADSIPAQVQLYSGFKQAVVYHITAVSTCTSGTTGKFQITIFAPIDNAFEVNPRVAHCAEGAVCELLISGYWPVTSLSVPGADPIRGDPVILSDFFWVNLNLAPGEEGNFCGFFPPLSSDLSIIPEFNSGQSLSVRFQLSRSDCTTDFITDAVAQIAVAKVEPEFQILTPVTSGSGTNEIPLFRIEDITYVYNLQLDPEQFTPGGTFSITVIFRTSNAPVQTTFFRVLGSE